MSDLTASAALSRQNRLLTAAEFHRLADVPPEREWFANLTNPRTKRAYPTAISDFMRDAGACHCLAEGAADAFDPAWHAWNEPAFVKILRRKSHEQINR